MKPAERLKEISKFWNEDTSLIGSRETAICYARDDIEYLISRVKRLEGVVTDSIDVLQVVQERMEESPYKDAPRVTATSAAIGQSLYYSRKALEKE